LFLYLSKHHATKTYWGSGGIAPRILDLGARWNKLSASRDGHFTPRERALCTHYYYYYYYYYYWLNLGNVRKLYLLRAIHIYSLRHYLRTAIFIINVCHTKGHELVCFTIPCFIFLLPATCFMLGANILSSMVHSFHCMAAHTAGAMLEHKARPPGKWAILPSPALVRPINSVLFWGMQRIKERIKPPLLDMKCQS
jgi:hypothetical protein